MTDSFNDSLEEFRNSAAGEYILQSLDAQCADTEEIMQQLKGLGIEVQCTTPTAPVQFEGSADGAVIYFRARGDSWSIAIAATEDDAVKGDNCFYYQDGTYGVDFDASWMPHRLALQIIRGGVWGWRNLKNC